MPASSRNGRTVATGVGAVVLAAGLGRRFGGAKLVAPLQGRPVVAHVCSAVALAREAGVVAAGWLVAAKGDEAVAALARVAGLEVIINEQPEEGVSGSIRRGLAGLSTTRNTARFGAALVVLGDQPLLRVETMRRLVESWREDGGPVIRPRYLDAPDTPGHPVLLDRAVWPLAERSIGDTGLAALLPLPRYIEVSGANPDVNTQDDLRMLKVRNTHA